MTQPRKPIALEIHNVIDSTQVTPRTEVIWTVPVNCTRQLL